MNVIGNARVFGNSIYVILAPGVLLFVFFRYFQYIDRRNTKVKALFPKLRSVQEAKAGTSAIRRYQYCSILLKLREPRRALAIRCMLQLLRDAPK